ncbi:unnamed protein product [Trichobilharzia regenti]|nr:unnamed protein product [Trichobilharzia regenti]
MGLTFIAAGSSVPDAIASVLVVREGRRLSMNTQILLFFSFCAKPVSLRRGGGG